MKSLLRSFLIASLCFSPAALFAQNLGSEFIQNESGSYAYEKTLSAEGVSAAALERKVTAWTKRALDPADGGNTADGMLCFVILREGANGTDFVSFRATMNFDNGAVTFRAKDFLYQSVSSETGNVDIPLQLLRDDMKTRIYPMFETRWAALINELQRVASR